MRFFNNRLLLFLLLIPVLILLGRIGYKTYQEFQQYTQNQKGRELLRDARELNALANTIENESFQSALAVSGQKAQDLASLQQVTDTALNHAQKHARTTDTTQALSSIDKAVTSARSLLKAKPIRHVKVFYNLYDAQGVRNALAALTSLAKSEASLSSSKDLRIFKRLATLKANNDVEKTMVGYILAKKMAMTPNDYKAWDRILSDERLPRFADLTPTDFSEKILQKIQPRTFRMLGAKARAFLTTEGIKGDYTIEPKRWIKALEEKDKRLSSAQDLLLNHASAALEHSAVQNKQHLINYLLQTLLFLSILAFLFYLLRKMTHEKHLLETTLHNIEFDLSKDKKAELQRIVQHRNTEEIYTFLAETIKESNQTKDLFLANMSHEIRTPLNGIVGFTQLLKTTPLNDDQDEFITVIEESSENLLTIVNDILDLSKIKAEKIELEEVSFNPVEKFESSVETYGAKALQKDIDFGVYIDPTLPSSLLGDPTRISQILVNLISNAIKFTGTYGEVSVFCERVHEDDENIAVKFSVKDTGIGIALAQQKRIFEAFSQADSSTTRQFGGTGLGLSISSKLVSLMGSKLEIESEAGEGSTFYFTLSLKRDPYATPAERPNFDGISVGLMLPKHDIKRQVDRNLESYLRYFGADFSIYYEDTIYDLDKHELPELLFVDQRYVRRAGEIERTLTLSTSIALLASGQNKKQLEKISDQLGSLIYKPLNYTKTLKALQKHLGGNTKKPQIHAPNITFQNLHVLVAEDNRINQKLITTTLKNLGIDVTIASNGKEALMLRKQNDYDLIFMDIQMPVMNGMEATQEILHYEKVANQKHVPIIALTANALRGDREKYLEAGMDNYTPKPINLDLLKEIIREYYPEKTLIEAKKSIPDDNQEIKKDIQTENAPKTLAATDTSSRRVNEDKEAHPPIVESKDILLYAPQSLMASIHLRVLELEGYHRLDHVTNESAFLERLDTTHYRYVLADNSLLTLGDCLLAEILAEKNTGLYLWGEATPSPCEHAQHYTTIPELKERMRRQKETSS